MAQEASEAIAGRVVAALCESLAPLRDYPDMGALRPALGDGLRVVFHEPYAIYYRPMPAEVVVIRVLHGARDARAVAGRGGFG